MKMGCVLVKNNGNFQQFDKYTSNTSSNFAYDTLVEVFVTEDSEPPHTVFVNLETNLTPICL